MAMITHEAQTSTTKLDRHQDALEDLANMDVNAVVANMARMLNQLQVNASQVQENVGTLLNSPTPTDQTKR